MKFKAYLIINDAVDRGVVRGWRRVLKHTDQPDDDVAVEQIAQEVMNALSEVLEFDDEPRPNS